MGYAETPTGARVCKGEAQGVLSYQNLKGIFTNTHMLYGERGGQETNRYFFSAVGTSSSLGAQQERLQDACWWSLPSEID